MIKLKIKDKIIIIISKINIKNIDQIKRLNKINIILKNHKIRIFITHLHIQSFFK